LSRSLSQDPGDALTKLFILNPFGTGKFDDVLKRTLEPVRRCDTEFDVEHLDKGPEYFRFWYFKTLAEVSVIEKSIWAQKAGYDGVYIGCSYDPGVKEAREIVDIPVVGATAPAACLATQLGRRFAFVTDTYPAVLNTWDLLRKYGLDSNCSSMEAVGLGIEEVAASPDENMRRVVEAAKRAVEKGAEVIILGCTIVAAFFTDRMKHGKLPSELSKITFLDANIAAFKTLELLVEIKKKAGIEISRYAYYADPKKLAAKDYLKYRQLMSLGGTHENQ
jgi:allantoin racemase